MGKYIDADRLRSEIEKTYKSEIQPWLSGVSATSAIYDYIYPLIDSLQQEQPELTQVPCIEQEIQKKGWVDYGLLISEIGLHRSNAIDRIKETKERATEIKRNIAPHDLAILGKYLESVGKEIVLCCLQRYCMDFMFTQDEVKEILQQEQPEVDLKEEIASFFSKNPIPHEHITGWPLLKNTALHFFNLGLNARK